jgi:hypothetical protein
VWNSLERDDRQGEAQLKQGFERIAQMILGTEKPKCYMDKRWYDRNGLRVFYYWLKFRKADQVQSA